MNLWAESCPSAACWCGQSLCREVQTPCHPEPAGFPHLLLFDPCEDAGANPAENTKSDGVMYAVEGIEGNPRWALCGWLGYCRFQQPVAEAVPAAGIFSSSLPAVESGKVVLEGGPLWPDSILGSPTLRHIRHAGVDHVAWMLLSPCAPLVTNPFHPHSPPMLDPMGFLPSLALDAGDPGRAVAGTQHSPCGFPVLVRTVSHLS